MSDSALEGVAEALVVRPGDTLIVRVSPSMAAEQVARCSEVAKAALGERVPGVEVVVVAAEQLAVYRPEGEQLIFVTIEWDGPKGRVADPFGPWTVREDGSHLAEIQDFLERWRDAEVRPGMTVFMWRPTAPDAYDAEAAGT